MYKQLPFQGKKKNVYCEADYTLINMKDMLKHYCLRIIILCKKYLPLLTQPITRI